MGLLIYSAVVVLNLFFVFLKKSSRIAAVFSAILLAIVVLQANTESGDLLSYKNEFYVITRDSYAIEKGYTFLTSLFHSIGLSFDFFRVTVLFLGFFAAFFSVRRYTQNYNLIILLYCLTMFIFNVVSLRSYIAFVLILFALTFLLSRHPLFFILAVIASCFIHSSSAFALIFAIPYLLKKAKFDYVKGLFYVACFCFLMAAFIFIYRPFGIHIMTFVNNYFLRPIPLFRTLAARYIEDIRVIRPNFGYVVLYFLMCVLLFLSRKQLSHKKWEFNYLLSCVFLGGFIMPLAMMNQIFIRLLFFGLFISFVSASIVVSPAAYFRDLHNRQKKTKITVSQNYYGTIKVGLIRIESSIYLLALIFVAFGWFAMIYLRHEYGFNIIRLLG